MLVNLTSGTPDHARARAAWAQQHGIGYVDGKIMAVPSMIGQPAAFLLYSGSEEAFATHRTTLGHLGATTYFGDEPGRASLYDLALLGLMYATMTGFMHSVAVMDTEGVDAATFLPHATEFLANVSVFLADVAAHIQASEYGSTEATLDMQVVAKDHIIEVSRAGGVDSAIPTYVKALMERAIAAGHGGDDMGRLVELIATSRSATV